jgi:DNA-binding transcriptional regulator YiaG
MDRSYRKEHGIELCKKLKALRKKKGASQPDAAYMLGVSTHSVFRWENGKAYPRNAVTYRALKDLIERWEDETSSDQREDDSS